MKIETLHSHTTKSDGEFNHLEVLNLCKKYNIGTVAFTDHDSLPSERDIKILKAYKGPVKWVCGIEMSTDFHMVGLFVDPTNKNLKEHCKKSQEARVSRMRDMVKNLKSLGFIISEKDCLNASGGETVGRPHIVKTLKNRSENLAVIEKLRKKMELASRSDSLIRESYQLMIERGEDQYPYVLFLSDDSFIKGVYVDYKYRPSPKESSNLIKNSGGLSFFAHYSFDKTKFSYTDLENLLKDGALDGIETVYGLGFYNLTLGKGIKEDIKVIKTLLGKYHKLASGGADAHKEEDFRQFSKDNSYNKETVGMTERIIKQSGVSTKWSSL